VHSMTQQNLLLYTYAGKIEARNTLRNSLRKGIESNQRELFEPIFMNPNGGLVFGNDSTRKGTFPGRVMGGECQTGHFLSHTYPHIGLCTYAIKLDFGP